MEQETARAEAIIGTAQASSLYKGSKALQQAVADVQRTASALDSQVQAVAGAKQALTTARTQEDLAKEDFRRAMSVYVKQVDIASQGSLDSIHTLGLLAKGEKTTHDPNAPLEAPTGLVASSGKHPGEVVLKFARPRGAKSFVIETSASSTGPFASAGGTTRTRATLKGLTPGATIFVHVASVGPKGQSPFTTAVMVTVR